MTISSIEPASADASFRRYFRAKTVNNKVQETWVVMDAPPEKESITEFIDIAEQLAQTGVHTPEIRAKDIENGFLLLEDLGSRPFLDELKDNPNALYSDAISALIKIQQGSGSTSPTKNKLPVYDKTKLNEEMDLFEQWYLNKHLGLTLDAQKKQSWEECKQILIDACLEQPQVWVHRDYHSRNLMITDDNSPGVIDFQDMVTGPIAYDLASIFKDCYIEWPRAQQRAWLEEYRAQANEQLGIQAIGQAQLLRWYDLTALQRHLKVLGIFCRLYYRDGKDQYLNDLPLVAKYTLEALDLYPEFKNFKQYFAPLITQALKG